jgi:hypothetical protein
VRTSRSRNSSKHRKLDRRSRRSGNSSSAICGIGDMPVNEALGVLAQIVICIEGSLQDLKGDVL